MSNEITKQMMKDLNKIKDTLGITAFNDIMSEFFKISEKYNVVYESREKWTQRCKKAESELKSLKMESTKLGRKE